MRFWSRFLLELSHHILDIAENATRAGSKTVRITLTEDTHSDRLTLEVADDGRGMSAEERGRALDPFFTTKKVRRVGLGLPMLADAAQRTGGTFTLDSAPGRGTRLEASFGLCHLDRQPLGDVAASLVSLIAGNPDVDFVYRHRHDAAEYVLDTREIRQELDGVPMSHRDVLKLIRDNIVEGLEEIGSEG